MITVEELEAAEGVTLGLTLDVVAPVLVIYGTLKPSYLVDLVLRRTLVVSTRTWALER